ncbi:hypothetical protein CXB51_026083 [Gossypium anomalum]|uniref:Piwi domain-containing protein n=1 Tax=Gossypium anomalum TaxID=47600 RepID=A0A8J6CVB3_9ROSI|nr:hypothetical protein CXB51_026083 [Gossypium anomalum]
MLMLGQTPSIPVVSKVPTIILGMGALLGFLEQSYVQSIAAMVSSRRWRLISSYGALGRTQSLKLKMIDSFCKNQFLTKLMMGSPDNVLHGTVIDNKVCHPKNNNFYLGTYAGMIGITRQTHYHVLLDQVGFSADDLQEFLHSWGQFMKIKDASETSSSYGGMYAPGVTSVPQLSRLKDKVSNFILIR